MARTHNKRLRNLVFSIAVPLVATLGSLLAAELVLRMVFDVATMPLDAGWQETRGIGAMPNARKLFVPDDELGFRPLHDGKVRSVFGCNPNNYPADKSATQRMRLLFIGDSVTDRGKIIRALRSLFGDGKYEYWNAGVSAYNTEQEVKYYLRYNRKIRPDHVVLTFHNNDFATTPFAYFDENDRLVRYFLRKPAPFGLNPWLFEHSLLYRKTVDLVLGAWDTESRVTQDVELSLAELKQAVAADDGRFTVLLLPILAPREAWKRHERENHRRAKEIFERLGIRYFDLTPALEQVLRQGIDPGQEPGDTWHPSDEAAALFVHYLYAKGFSP